MGIRYTLPDHAGINSRRIGASGSEVNKLVQVHLKTPQGTNPLVCSSSARLAFASALSTSLSFLSLRTYCLRPCETRLRNKGNILDECINPWPDVWEATLDLSDDVER